MNTPAHLIFGLAAFGKPGDRMVIGAALSGAMLPDLSLYLLAGAHLFVLGTPPEVVFGELYYSEGWQAIFRIDNSFIVWGIILALALMVKYKAAIALAGAALLHLALDFPFHNEDARAHFWPVTEWKFYSPISYWDPNFYGHIFAPIEAICVLAATIWIWRRFDSRPLRGLAVALCAMQVVPTIAWMTFGP